MQPSLGVPETFSAATRDELSTPTTLAMGLDDRRVGVGESGSTPKQVREFRDEDFAKLRPLVPPSLQLGQAALSVARLEPQPQPEAELLMGAAPIEWVTAPPNLQYVIQLTLGGPLAYCWRTAWLVRLWSSSLFAVAVCGGFLGHHFRGSSDETPPEWVMCSWSAVVLLAVAGIIGSESTYQMAMAAHCAVRLPRAASPVDAADLESPLGKELLGGSSGADGEFRRSSSSIDAEPSRSTQFLNGNFTSNPEIYDRTLCSEMACDSRAGLRSHDACRRQRAFQRGAAQW